MHRLKKVTLEVALGLLIPLSVFSADDDGTFTITIQGPDVEETAPVRAPARTTPRRATVTPRRQASAATVSPRQAPAARTDTVNTAPVQPGQYRTYNVVSGDTIWSVAHRYAQANRNINEFQVVASIYRNNPQAFGNSNVNNLLRTTLRVPSDEEIALENTQTGSALLASGSMNLPPLQNPVPAATVPNVQNQRAVAAVSVPQGTVPSNVTQNTNANQNNKNNDIPVYTATETRIKEVQKLREAEENGELIPSGDSNKDAQNPNEKYANTPSVENNALSSDPNQPQIQPGQVNPNQKGFTPEQIEQILALQKQNSKEAVDVKSIRIMLEENKKQIDQKTKVIQQQLADAIARMKKSSAVTAQTAADNVSSLSSQYDNIIAGIQQDLIEIKGNVSKLSQDNDRMREMLLANDEKIEDMQLQMSQFTVSSVDASIDMDKPVMMILFGAGLLSLVILILFIIFKARARAHARKYNDDFDFDDGGSLGSDDLLLSDDNGSIEIETPTGDIGEDEPPADTKDEAANTAPAAEDASKAQTSSESAPKAETTADNTAAETTSEDAKAQAEWDKAAEEAPKEESNDQNVLDEWSKALNEDQKTEEKETEVEGKSDDASVADAWAAALGEQENAEKAQEEPKKDEQEDMAAAWAAALGEQEGGESPAEEKAPAEEPKKDEQEDMAAAWAAALGEQEGGESPAEEKAPAEEPKKDAQEDMAADWAAALNEQEGGDKNETSEEDNSSPVESTQAEELKKSMESAKSIDDAESKAVDDSVSETSSEDVNIDEITDVAEPAAEEPVAEATSEDINIDEITDAAEPVTEEPVAEATSEDINIDEITDAAEPVAEEPVAEATSEDINIDELTDAAELVAEEPVAEATSEDINIDELTDAAEPAAEEPVAEATSEDISIDEITDAEEPAAEEPVAEAISEDISIDENTDTLEPATEDQATEATSEETSTDEQVFDVDDLVQSEETDVSAEDVSGEESSISEAMENSKTEDPEFDSNSESEKKADGAESSNVDEVVDDEIDLEVLLRPVDQENSADELVQNEDVTNQEDTSLDETVVDETQTEDVPVESEVQSDADDSLSEENETDVNDLSETAQAAEAAIEPDGSETESSSSGEVVSWEVPQDEYDVVSGNNADENVTDEVATDENPEEEVSDLESLEARINSSSSYVDPQSESELMNMLGNSADGQTDELLQNEQNEFTSDEIARMINGDLTNSGVSDLQKISNTIGPISTDGELDEQPVLSEELAEGEKVILTPKEHQYYVDELNLARLYFETGDTDEAIKIIEDVQEHGSEDLRKEANKVMAAYGS